MHCEGCLLARQVRKNSPILAVAMYLTFRALAIAVLTIAAWQHAHAENYVRALGVMATLDSYTSSYAVGVSVGRDLPRLLPHLGVEGEFFKSFSKMHGPNGNLTFNKTAVFATYSYPIDPRIHITGKAGLRYTAFKDTVSGDSSDVGMDWGIGTLLALDHNRNVVLEFITSDENKFSQFAIGLQFFY